MESGSKKILSQEKPGKQLLVLLTPLKIESKDEKCNVSSTDTEDFKSQSSSSEVGGTDFDEWPIEIVSDGESPDNFKQHHNGIKLEKNNDDAVVSFVPIAIPEKVLPSFNIPEKVIIVLDSALDVVSTSFEMSNGKKQSPLDMLKHSLKIFLHNKSFINKNHQFALISLGRNTAYWKHNFTNSIKSIISSMASIAVCEPEDIFNLNSLFELITSKILPLASEDNFHLPPRVIYRIILTYGRSYSIPVLEPTPLITELLRSPYFTVDVVMTHEHADTTNQCERIFKALQDIDPKGSAYTFSVARNSRDLHNAIAKLLAHPLQRPLQADADYKIHKK